ncbi:MAG: caspase family protein, partial [Nitrososphaerales archaeon]|nr:caspase family protein [Nitrososphaerales archaeon]
DTYEARFEGKVIVSNVQINFVGILSFSEYKLKVEFTIENTFPDLIKGAYSASGDLKITIEEVKGIQITPKASVKGSGKGDGEGSTKDVVASSFIRPPPSERRWAVIIGISDYDGTKNDIKYADDDAIDMLHTLINVYGYKRENIRLLISDYQINNATRDNIIDAINWLRDKEVSEEDEVVFFYSGHGARGMANDGDNEAIDEGIVPYESTSKSIIWDGELKAMFSNFNSKRIVFIFDSCYSGGMTDLKATGRIIVMSCSESGLSYEYDTLRNGVFTYFYVEEGMLMRLADTNPNDGNVTVEEAFNYAKPKVSSYANRKQVPTISDSFTNDLLL